MMNISTNSGKNLIMLGFLVPFTTSIAEVSDYTGDFTVNIPVPDCRFASGAAGSKVLFEASMPQSDISPSTWTWSPLTTYTSEITLKYEFDAEDISACAGFVFQPSAGAISATITGMTEVSVSIDENDIVVPDSAQPIDFVVTLTMVSGETRPVTNIEDETVDFTITTTTQEPVF